MEENTLCVNCNEFLDKQKFHHTTLKSLVKPNICKKCMKVIKENEYKKTQTCNKCNTYNSSGFIQDEYQVSYGSSHYIQTIYRCSECRAGIKFGGFTKI